MRNDIVPAIINEHTCEFLIEVESVLELSADAVARGTRSAPGDRSGDRGAEVLTKPVNLLKKTKEQAMSITPMKWGIPVPEASLPINALAEANNCDPLVLTAFMLAATFANEPGRAPVAVRPFGACAFEFETSKQNRNKVMATLGARLPVGAYVVWLDQVLPMYRKDQFKVECVIGIVGSTNHRFRVLTFFRRIAAEAA
jgi:hypothetical protein